MHTSVTRLLGSSCLEKALLACYGCGGNLKNITYPRPPRTQKLALHAIKILLPGLRVVSLMRWGAPFGSGEFGVARRFLVGSELAAV